MKSLAEEERHCHEFVDSHGSADVRQHVSHIEDPHLQKSVHAGAIDDGPHDRGHASEDPCGDRSQFLLARMTQLPDAFIVLLHGIPDPDEVASRENR